MKTFLSAAIVFAGLIVTGCKKDHPAITPVAAFSFRGDTTSAFKMATYDTCTLISNAAGTDSVAWNFGNGITAKGKNAVLSYPASGNYTVTLTVVNKDGATATQVKHITILDRILKRIIVKKVYWDTIPNRIPYFNAVWPQTSTADISVRAQHLSYGDSIVPVSGILYNSPYIFQTAAVKNISYNTSVPFEIPVTGKVIIDKPEILDRSFVLSLMATNATDTYCLMMSFAGGTSFGIIKEDFASNSFVVTCDLFSSVELDCDFE